MKPAAKPATIGELWSEWEPVREREVSENTWRAESYRHGIWARTQLTLDDEREVLVTDIPWSDMTPRTAEIYRIHREKSVQDTTVNRELITMSALLTYFTEVRKTIPKNPLKGWNRADEESHARQTYLSPESAKRFIEGGPPIFQDILWTAYRSAGMRQGEARNLRKSEVDLDTGCFNLPSARNKNRKPRVIPFPSDVAAIVRRNLEGSRGEFVFVSPKDHERRKPIKGSTFQNWIVKARKRSGIVGFDGENVVAHTLRHAAVTDLLQEKVDPFTVMAVAGMSPETLKRYNKFSPLQQSDFRAHLERQYTGPTKLTAELQGARKTPRAALSIAPQVKAAVEE